jgi:hypothetical protein
MSRDYNYEARASNARFEATGSDKFESRNESKRGGLYLPKRVYTLSEVPDRYHIVSQLSEEARVRLEGLCSSTFIGCIDFDMTTAEDAAMAFDTLYSLYCEKFHGVDLEEEKLNEREGMGLKSLV